MTPSGGRLGLHGPRDALVFPGRHTGPQYDVQCTVEEEVGRGDPHPPICLTVALPHKNLSQALITAQHGTKALVAKQQSLARAQ